jgi:DNA-binding NarL/FixJ family response regulator
MKQEARYEGPLVSAAIRYCRHRANSSVCAQVVGVKRLRVVVADGQPLFLAGIRGALGQAEDIEIVGEADSGARVLSLIRNTRPDFVLMDYSMPDFDGLACLDTIRHRHPEVKVALISGLRDPELIEAALRRGACAFVLKSINPEDLAAVIRQVVNGTVFQALEFAEPEKPEAAESAGLTKREVSILQALARGLSNEAIAKELWITRQTVKFHVRNVYRKLGVSNRTEAARYAYQHGLVPNAVEDELALAGAV